MGGVCVFSCVRLFAASWTVACQATLAMGASWQEYWSGLPFPSPGDLPNRGMEAGSPALAGRFFFFFNHWATSVRPVQYFTFTICSSKSFFLIFYYFLLNFWIHSVHSTFSKKKKKELCSSVKSFIFLEIVHSLRPMLSFFVWRISSTPQVCLRLSASLRHRWLLLLGGRAPHRPLLVPPGSGNCPLPALSGLRVGVGRRHFVIAVAPAYCTNLWLPTFCLRFVHLSVWDSPLNT